MAIRAATAPARRSSAACRTTEGGGARLPPRAIPRFAMGYALSSTASFAMIGGQAIFLDLRSDRYLALAPEQHAALEAAISQPDSRDATLSSLEPLVRAGLLVEAEGSHVLNPCAHAARPRTSALDYAPKNLSLIQFTGAVRSLLVTKARLRYGALNNAVDRLRRRKQRYACGNMPAEQLHAVVAAFDKTRMILSPHRQCLPRSLALAHRLTGLGFRVDLVFGVAINPFNAHCWVQHNDVVLNDRLEHVSGYVPILVV